MKGERGGRKEGGQITLRREREEGERKEGGQITL